MNDVDLTHPDRDRLTAFSLGRLDDAASAHIERHIAGCDACRERAAAAGDDSLVSLLRSAGGQPEPTEAIPPQATPAAASQDATAADGSAGGPAPVADVLAELAGHPRYRVVALLGVGGMGSVYKAEHLLMERAVALKVINRGLLDNPATVERFRREVKAAARLAHPNIVTAYDAEQAGDLHVLVMEYVEGRTLARLVAEKGPLPVREACEYVRQAALGLQHAFEKGMVHRDIKPANLMLTPSGQVKVLDFGLARFALESGPPLASAVQGTAGGAEAGVGPSGSLTQVGMVMGTPDYIAPEQAADAHTADVRADIYSLGCTLYDLLAGHAPFPEGTAVQKVLAHARERPRPLTEVRKNVPAPLARVVERMMAKDPARRYQTPAEVAQALAPFAAPGRRHERWWASARWWVSALGMVAPAVLGLLSLLVSHFVSVIDTHKVVPPLTVGGSRHFPGHSGSVKSVAFAPNGKFVLSGSGYPTNDDTARVWEVDSGKELLCFRGHRSPVYAVAVSPDSRLALSGSSDQTACLWEVATGKELLPLKGHKGPVECLAFAPDGRRAATGSSDRTIRLWDLDTGRELKQFTGHSAGILALTFSADGQRLLSGSRDQTMRLWDVDSGTAVRTFEGHGEPVSGVAVSPDGRLALSASDGVRLWDLADGRVVAQFEWAGGHAECVAFSPDGRRALGGGHDAIAHLWDVPTGRQVAVFPGHTGAVWSVAFSPDGKLAVSGGGDSTVRLWRLPEAAGDRKP
jgi:serine/threonine protein kinase